jgi:hypothetical protein
LVIFFPLHLIQSSFFLICNGACGSYPTAFVTTPSVVRSRDSGRSWQLIFVDIERAARHAQRGKAERTLDRLGGLRRQHPSTIYL